MLCQRLDLSFEALVAIDGSKFKAANRRDRTFTFTFTFTSAKSERRMQDIEASINRYQKYGRYSRYGYADMPPGRQLHPFATEAEALMAGYSAAGSG